jgi:hypothetical protein
MFRRNAVQPQDMAQQPQHPDHAQSQDAISSRGPFPWIRLFIAMGIVILLALLFALSVLSTGHVISYIWVILAPALISWIIAIIPVLQYFFPLSPVTWKAGQSSPQVIDASPAQSPSESVSVAQPQPSSVSNSPLPTASVLSTVQTIQPVHIFSCNEPQLPNPKALYGRAYERSELIQRTSIRASTAIDGTYRIGKSWLLQYLQQVAPTHPQLGSHVRIGRFSATHPQCQAPAGFVKRALEMLNVPNHDVHSKKLQLAQLALAARDCQNLGIIPVLCIDEFAGLIGKQGFDTTFLSELRAVAADDGLVLITASKQPLHEVIEQMTGQTSPLFNIMPRLVLKPFTDPEARTFIDEKGQQAGFDQQERAFFLECAAISTPEGIMGWPPLRLQLVGKMLHDEKLAAVAEQRAYDVSNATYQAEFKKRLNEQYKAMVKYP